MQHFLKGKQEEVTHPNKPPKLSVEMFVAILDLEIINLTQSVGFVWQCWGTNKIIMADMVAQLNLPELYITD